MATIAAPIALHRGFRFDPLPEAAIAYYLHRLIHGQPLGDADQIIHKAEVYSGEPKDLAAAFPRLPITGDRFFFTRCKLQKRGIVRATGAGSWVTQGRTKVVKNRAGETIGCCQKLKFKKSCGEQTDWLMDEYHTCMDQAVDGDTERVFCKMYVSPMAKKDSAALKETAMLDYARPTPAAPMRAPVSQPPPSQQALKRPAAPVVEPPCNKRIRPMAAVPASAMPSCAVARPRCMPASSASPLPSVRMVRPGSVPRPPPQQVLASPAVSRPPPPVQASVARPSGCLITACGPPRRCAPPVTRQPPQPVQSSVSMPPPVCSAPFRPTTTRATISLDPFERSLANDSLEDQQVRQSPAAQADIDEFASQLDDILDDEKNPAAQADIDDFASQLDDILDDEKNPAGEAGKAENPLEGLAMFDELKDDEAMEQGALDVLKDINPVDGEDQDFLTVPLMDMDYDQALFY